MARIAILLPLIFVFSFSVQAEIVTANAMLKKGTVLTDEDVSIKLSAGENFAEVRALFVGSELRRTIYAGRTISKSYIGPPILVKRNTSVTMVYTYGTMRLTAKGRALGAGALGDSISVMNMSSRKKVTGIISGSDMIEVN